MYVDICGLCVFVKKRSKNSGAVCMHECLGDRCLYIFVKEREINREVCIYACMPVRERHLFRKEG